MRLTTDALNERPPNSGRPGGRDVEVVDVIIAAWNRADTIARAVDSVLHEACVRSVIVVDDASSDDTAARAEALALREPKLIVLRAKQNMGPAAARNLALERSTAPWIAILDADDYLLPGRLDTLLNYADGWDFVADDLLQIPEAELHQPDQGRRLSVGATWPEQVTLETFVLANLSRPGRERQEMGFLKPIIRRSFLDENGLIYNPSLRLGEDYVLYARALAAGARFRLIPGSGYVSVMRSNSLSARHAKHDLEELLASDRALTCLPGLSRGARGALRRHVIGLEKKIQWLVTIEAVKERNVRKLSSAFCLSPTVSAYLVFKLMQEIRGRLAGLARPSNRAGSGRRPGWRGIRENP